MSRPPRRALVGEVIALLHQALSFCRWLRHLRWCRDAARSWSGPVEEEALRGALESSFAKAGATLALPGYDLRHSVLEPHIARAAGGGRLGGWRTQSGRPGSFTTISPTTRTNTQPTIAIAQTAKTSG
jgi:hypothetical protein